MKKYIIFLLTSVIFTSAAYGYEYSDYTWYTYNGHQYAATFTVGNWIDVQAEASAIGGHLVTINDASENNWLTQQFDLSNSANANSQVVSWIGYRYEAGSWGWENGEPVTYENICTSFCGRTLGDGPHMYLHTASHTPGAPGTWNYHIVHDNLSSHYLDGIIEINVVPEPISSTLFVVGAATLGFRRLRKRVSS